MITGNILDTIGNTTLFDLQNVVPEGCARILVKLEYENPTGSMKDRMALAMVSAAEERGALGPGGRVVEYTGGSTGVSLALVCRARGYPLSIVTSDAFSPEKRRHMQALGAELTVIESDQGRMTEKLTRDMIAAAGEIAKAPGSYWTDQLNNADQVGAYHRLGREIWEQTGGQVDAFIQSVGTSASLRGTAECLRKLDPGIRIEAVEPAESAVLSGGPTGAHKIEGVGAGFVVPLWRPDIVDHIHRIDTEASMKMARRLASEEALFVGTSTGSNVLAAIETGLKLGPDKTVVTIACDSGIKYLNTALYANLRRV